MGELELTFRNFGKSYYYAHGHHANGPEWDGKEEPRLLSTTPIEVKVDPIDEIFAFYSILEI